MLIRRLFTRDEAVSPVVGTILVVGIVVILATAAGAFLLGLNTEEVAPQVRFSFDFKDYDSSREDALAIVHEGGPTIRTNEGGTAAGSSVKAGNIYIRSTKPFEDDTGVTGAECTTCEPGNYVAPVNYDDEGSTGGFDWKTGENYVIYGVKPSTKMEDAKVTIFWQTDDGSSKILAEWEGDS